MDELMKWFVEHGGTVDGSAFNLADIPNQGRGAVALRDLPKGHVIFTIPRNLTLSTRTSTLPRLFGEDKWKHLHLDKGWSGVILCMMWEEARGGLSRWFRYLEDLPRDFSTPMFWNEEELKELEGTAVVDKIGRQEAEKDYQQKIIPALKAMPDLFDESLLHSTYSLENYHRMGSRILSRSFHVERWDEEDAEDDQSIVAGRELIAQPDGMDVDQPLARHAYDLDESREDGMPHGDDDDDSSEGSSDEEDPSDVAMVPMADMLNAQYGSENAKLFYERTELKMVTTKEIKRGEQIYNTYGNPPNSDLLRRYGHVDLVDLPGFEGKQGNPADVVEIPADLAVETIKSMQTKLVDVQERIDWWLEEGGDDVFVVEFDLVVPEGLISFVKLLTAPSADWEKARNKGKPPKPKLDGQVLPIIVNVFRKRLEQYRTVLEHDETLLSSSGNELSYNKRNALVIRIGEKRILSWAIEKLQISEMESMKSQSSLPPKSTRDAESKEKRKRESIDGGKQGKKSRR